MRYHIKDFLKEVYLKVRKILLFPFLLLNVDEILIYRGFCRFIKEIRKRNFDLTIDSFNTYELKQAFMAYLSGARYGIRMMTEK